MAEEVGSLRVGLSINSAKFEQSLASVDRNIKALGAEMSIARAKGTDWGNSLEGLSSKQKTLSTLLESQDTKLRKLNASYQKAVSEQGASSKAAENLAVKLNKATAEYTRTETELKDVNISLNKQQAEISQTATKWDSLNTSVAAASDKFTAAGEKMKSTGQTLSTAITLPIGGMGVASVKTAMDFEAQMDRVGAIADATAGDMEAMTETALKLGAETSKSASEVALGFEEMAAMGFNANEIIGAMPGVIAAAEASGSDMAQTAEVMASTLNIFSLKAKDASKVADVLAKTANISAASLTDMQYALKYAGPPAAALGVSLEETSAAIGIMTNAGMKGEQAGTTLRGALLGLLDPSEENSKMMNTMGIAITDNNGNFVGLAKLIDNLKESMEGQTDTQKAATLSALVGKEAVSGMLSLMKAGPDTIDKMTESLENSGGASAEAASKMKDNLKGALDELGGTLETAAITAGDILAPSIEKASEKIQGLIEDFQELSPEAQENILKMAGLAAAIGPAVLVGGHFATSLGSIAKLAAPLIPMLGAGGLATSVGALVNPIGLTVAGVGALGLGIYTLTQASKDNTKEALKTLESKQAEIEKNDELIESYEALRYKNLLSNDQMLRYLDIQAVLESTNAPDRVAALKDEQAKLLKESTLTNDQMDEFLGLNQKVIDTAPSTVTAISSQGVAFAENTIALKELNAEKAKELENDARDTLKDALEQETKEMKKQVEYLNEIHQANENQAKSKAEVDKLGVSIAQHEKNILDWQNQKNGASLQEIASLEEKIRREKDLKAEASTSLLRAEELISTYGKQVDQKNGLLKDSRKELALIEEAKFKYEEIILAQAGITSEKGNGLTKINEEIAKQEQLKGKISDQLAAGKLNTTEFQEQNDAINAQIGKLQDAKSELERIKDTAGNGVYVNLYENPKNFWDTLDENLKRPITKTVSISYNNMNGPQEPGYAHGTNSHPGGPAIVGDGVGNNAGRELISLPNQKLLLSPAKPTLLNLPKGTSVLSAINTRKYLGRVPKYASGTKNTTTAKPFDVIDYDSRLKGAAEGSGVARIREIRNAEIASLEAKIDLLTKEGATIEQLNQAKEMESRLSKLQFDKSAEYLNRLNEQRITIEALNKAFKDKKITMAEYNKQVASAQAETHRLTAEQLAHNTALNDVPDEMESYLKRVRTIRQSNIDLLTEEIQYLTREGATVAQLNEAKTKQVELDRLHGRKQEEYANKLKAQQKIIDDINTKKQKGLITQNQYNDSIGEATVEMNNLKMESLAFYESLVNAQDSAAQKIRQNLANMMTEVSNSQLQAYETVMDAQLKDLSERNRKSEEVFKNETALYVEELKRQKDAALDSFDAQTKAHEASVERQIQNLNKKRDAEIAAIEAQLDALEEQEKTESRQEVEAGWGTEKETLNRRLTIANFMGDDDTVKAVQTEMADLDKEIAKQRLAWQREDAKEALSLEKEKIDQAYDQQEKALEDNLAVWKAEREQERENLEARYELRMEQFEAMREQQLTALENEHQNNLAAAEREYELQKERFAKLQEQLALHLKNGSITQAQANEAWLKALQEAGGKQVFQEIENQEKSKVALNAYVSAYLDIGKSYGNNLVDGVVSTLNTRLSEVQAAAARIKSAMSLATDTTSAMQSAAYNTRAITQATPATSTAVQPINILMDGDVIGSYAFSHATGALRQVSRKG